MPVHQHTISIQTISVPSIWPELGSGSHSIKSWFQWFLHFSDPSPNGSPLICNTFYTIITNYPKLPQNQYTSYSLVDWSDHHPTSLYQGKKKKTYRGSTKMHYFHAWFSYEENNVTALRFSCEVLRWNDGLHNSFRYKNVQRVELDGQFWQKHLVM